MASLCKRDFSDRKTLEKYSSAYTLSDMEIFVFPDLFYPLILANIMSPIIWEWRNDPWFENIEKKSFIQRANRIKQYIIQNYVFNLDLSTWGLTTKPAEIERFRDFIDMEMLRKSNALFGYEGDRYYFDIDIRKHFGLDKYDSDIIPYWKTETVEAMTAFRYRENFKTGGGECVSLSALYAAAMFIIGRVPLDKIFLIATPLHSQNFIIEKDGLITNNRRIVTKNMWFNGTSLSEKARRALENETVTIVAHITGHIHTLYDEASINPEAYRLFSTKLNEFLAADLTPQVFINFLRFKPRYKNHFQYLCHCSGNPKYILLDKMFEYEHNSRFSVASDTRELLLNEIEGDEFHLSPINGKILLNEAEQIIRDNGGEDSSVTEKVFLDRFGESHAELLAEMFREIRGFIKTTPRLPSESKRFQELPYPDIKTGDSRKEIMEKIRLQAETSELCMLTLYTYRQMDILDWLPFTRAALERNPVSCTALEGKTVSEAYSILRELSDESIYDGERMSLPDEVWNFRRGDGAEKAFLLAAFIIHCDRKGKLTVEADSGTAIVKYLGTEYRFLSSKKLRFRISVDDGAFTAC